MTEQALTVDQPIAAATTARLGPIEARERVEILDVLRGFAIFGILMVNMLFFSGPIEWVVKPPWAGINEVAHDFITFFFTGKFYSLFSMLFGLGLAVQMSRAEARGVPIARVYRRRLLVLLLIGLIHAVFVWYGDILHVYALLGFLLLVFRNRHPRKLLRAALISLLIPLALALVFGGLIELSRLDPVAHREISDQFAEQERNFGRQARESLLTYSRGTYAEILQQRVSDLARVDAYALIYAPHVFAMFLLGLYAGRERIFINVPERAAFFRKLLVWALIIGVAGNLATVLSRQFTDPLRPSLLTAPFTVFYIFGAPALMLFYVSAIVLASQNPKWRARLAPLGAVGRMALSNYLLQSIVSTTIFYSHGLGLFGTFTPVKCILLTVVIFALQIPLSVWWLQRFQFGPAEWLWRSLSYGQLQPMRTPVVESLTI